MFDFFNSNFLNWLLLRFLGWLLLRQFLCLLLFFFIFHDFFSLVVECCLLDVGDVCCVDVDLKLPQTFFFFIDQLLAFLDMSFKIGDVLLGVDKYVI